MFHSQMTFGSSTRKATATLSRKRSKSRNYVKWKLLFKKKIILLVLLIIRLTIKKY